MAKTIDGAAFRSMVDYAVRNLNKHCKTVNQLNVFPVPDGDTGTNMVTTIHRGLLAIGETLVDLPSFAKKFASAVVFEARGNSGVIVSQFLKGLADKFKDVDTIDGALFIAALEAGVENAYSAVATPVEGTMLTVLKDATEAVKKEFDGSESVNDIITSFIEHAKVSLENTPELLPVLKEAGVVDSGGAGIVYLFEGMKKYLDGESIDADNTNEEASGIDYDAFDEDTVFEFGYCTELLLQPLNGRRPFLMEGFKENLSELGDSLVCTEEKGKVRVHIHTHRPEEIFAFCHEYGEFLTVKVENMSVQHTELTKNIMVNPSHGGGSFAVVAVAYDADMQKMFIDMGADAVILCGKSPSTKDYIRAFEKTDKKHIILFPNGSDAMLSAAQAKDLYSGASVTVVSSKSIAACYAVLPALDYEEQDIKRTSASVKRILSGLYIASVAKRKNPLRYGNRIIERNDFYAFCGKELIAVEKSVEDAVAAAVKTAVEEHGKEILTLFCNSSVSEEELDGILGRIESMGYPLEVSAVRTDSHKAEFTLAFE